ncbi:hypothetical protein [Nostoc parmelioides]|uniref:Uncharacterized protein n=1 Tax=Nostoc parmelioides FACHB-3921 TaxID=2692909 RepID=A0ABR8BL67_9NOSO|nr:hypothetical protein [Nostoc parmelioides]MBD2254611.1 hypothetical protein [Nostoc parmelioides FACHB-3921]
MSLPVQVTFSLAPHIAKGLSKGAYVLFGNIVRGDITKNILGILRPITPTANQSSNNVLNLIISGTTLLTSGANIAVSAKGFSNVNHKLDKGFSDVSQRLDNIENIIQLSD